MVHFNQRWKTKISKIFSSHVLLYSSNRLFLSTQGLRNLISHTSLRKMHESSCDQKYQSRRTFLIAPIRALHPRLDRNQSKGNNAHGQKNRSNSSLERKKKKEASKEDTRSDESEFALSISLESATPADDSYSVAGPRVSPSSLFPQRTPSTPMRRPHPRNNNTT